MSLLSFRWRLCSLTVRVKRYRKGVASPSLESQTTGPEAVRFLMSIRTASCDSSCRPPFGEQTLEMQHFKCAAWCNASATKRAKTAKTPFTNRRLQTATPGAILMMACVGTASLRLLGKSSLCKSQSSAYKRFSSGSGLITEALDLSNARLRAKVSTLVNHESSAESCDMYSPSGQSRLYRWWRENVLGITVQSLTTCSCSATLISHESA